MPSHPERNTNEAARTRLPEPEIGEYPVGFGSGLALAGSRNDWLTCPSGKHGTAGRKSFVPSFVSDLVSR